MIETINNLYDSHKNSRFFQVFPSLFLRILCIATFALFFKISPLSVLLLFGLFLLFVFLYVFLQNPKLSLCIILFIYPSIYLYSREFKIFSETFYEISLSGFLNIFIVLSTVLYYFLGYKKLIRKPYLSMPILFFILSILPSFFFSQYKLISMRNLFRILMPISFYFIFVSKIKNEKQVRKILKILIYSSFIPLLIGLWQIMPNSPSWLFPVEKIPHGMRRICGTFEHPNAFAAFINFILLVTLLLFFKPKYRMNESYIFLTILMIICLFFTWTRAVWISFIFSSAILFYFLRLKKEYFVFAMLFLIFVFLAPGFQKAIKQRAKIDASARARLTLARYSLNEFKENPIFGSGLGMYSFLSRERFGEISGQYRISGGYAAHNDYLEFLVETGILGLLGYLFLLVSIIKLGFKQIYKQEVKSRYWGGLLIATVSAIAIIGLTDAGFSYGGIYFWTIVAIAELRCRLINEMNMFYSK